MSSDIFNSAIISIQRDSFSLASLEECKLMRVFLFNPFCKFDDGI